MDELRSDISALINSGILLYYPSQLKISLPIIDRIYRKITLDKEVIFPDVKLYDDIIVDGHHTYIAHALANKSISTIPWAKSSTTIKNEWKYVKFVEEDFDSVHEIKEHNKRDATYLDMSLEDFLDKLK